MFSFFSILHSAPAPIPRYKQVDTFNNIIPHIYIGNVDSLKTPGSFELIVNCTKHIGIVPGKKTIRIAVNDHPTESRVLLDSIKDNRVLEQIHYYVLLKRNVLVHCHAGMQRSCAIVAMYLMKYHGITPVEAIRFIPTKRSVAFYPEPTFRQAMHDF